MNSHSDIQKLLSAYCGDDLPVHDRTMVELHLKECPDCRTGLADLQATLQMIRTTPEVDPPPWMTSRIMAHINEVHIEKTGWLQRIFFPLHIKLPLEVIGLLMVCITGYYLTQTVEKELKGPSTLQELPGSLPQETKPSAQPAPALPPAIQPAAPQPYLQKGLERSADSVHQQPAPPTQQPVMEQPAGKSERSAPAAAGSAAEPAMKAVPATDFSNRSLEAAPVMKKKDAKGVQRQEVESLAPAPAGRAAPDSSGKYLPQLFLQLKVVDRAIAANSIQAIVLRSGGRIIEESRATTNMTRILIPYNRFNELLERLSDVGQLTERIQPPVNTTECEVTIQW